jgi:hypothetical protein
MNTLFTIEAKVIVRVRGIAGPFEQAVAWHVQAQNINEARSKYEKQVRQDFAYMQYESISFEYLRQIGTIL